MSMSKYYWLIDRQEAKGKRTEKVEIRKTTLQKYISSNVWIVYLHIKVKRKFIDICLYVEIYAYETSFICHAFPGSYIRSIITDICTHASRPTMPVHSSLLAAIYSEHRYLCTEDVRCTDVLKNCQNVTRYHRAAKVPPPPSLWRLIL